jgi:hypothetical protein
MLAPTLSARSISKCPSNWTATRLRRRLNRRRMSSVCKPRQKRASGTAHFTTNHNVSAGGRACEHNNSRAKPTHVVWLQEWGGALGPSCRGTVSPGCRLHAGVPEAAQLTPGPGHVGTENVRHEGDA